MAGGHQHLVTLTVLGVLPFLEGNLKAAPVLDEADVASLKARRVIVPAHGTEHDNRHRPHHEVAVSLLPHSIRLREEHDDVPLERLLSILRVEPEFLHRCIPYEACRKALRRLVVEEILLLKEGNRGRRRLHRRERLRVVYHRL